MAVQTTLKLEDAWIYQISVLADKVARRVSDIVSEVSGLNLSQWRVIAAIADQPGLSGTQVAAITPMDKGIVSRATSRLVTDGLIERKASDKDGRLSHLYLTKRGMTEYRKIMNALSDSGADGQTILLNGQDDMFLSLLKDAIAAYE